MIALQSPKAIFIIAFIFYEYQHTLLIFFHIIPLVGSIQNQAFKCVGRCKLDWHLFF